MIHSDLNNNAVSAPHPKGWATLPNIGKGLITKLSTISLITACLIFIEPNDSYAIDYNSPITSVDNAIKNANAITGIDEFVSATSREKTDNIGASLETYLDSTTAYLSEQLNGRTAWKVTYNNLYFELDSVESSRRNFYADCEVWLDSATGQLLLMTIDREDSPEPEFRMPTASEYKSTLVQSGEKYHDLPKSLPTMNMVEALRILSTKHSIKSKQIRIQYVMYSAPLRVDEKTPCWVIYQRGLNPHPKLIDYQRHASTHWRVVMDANTGKRYTATNTPYPDLRDEFKTEKEE